MSASSLKKIALAAVLATTTMLPAQAEPASGAIDLTYVWTAHAGQEERLVETYAIVGTLLEANEPGLVSYDIAISETGDQIVIRETFANGDALAFHLSETAAAFFPQLVDFATPGPFIFRGDVPAPLKTAAYEMNMGAIFLGDTEGFTRP